MSDVTEAKRQTASWLRYYLKLDGEKHLLWDYRDRPSDEGQVGADPPGGHAVQDQNLIALWRMDEYVAAADLVDETGRHTGTVTNSPPVGSGQVGPTLNASRTFTGDEYFAFTQKLEPSDSDPNGSDEHYGAAVDIAGDWAIVGCPNKSISPGFTVDGGQAYILKRNTSTGVWAEHAILAGDVPTTGWKFGSSVSINADADTIAVAEPGATIGGTTGAGQVYIYHRSGTTWSQATASPVSATPASNQDAQFGGQGGTNEMRGVALSAVGDTLVIGEPRDSGAGTNRGAFHVFERSPTGPASGTWTHQQKGTNPDTTDNDYFGATVSIDEATGDILLIGGWDTTRGPWVWDRSGSTWTFRTDMDSTPAQTGTDHMAVDGATAMFMDDEGGGGNGIIHEFEGAAASWSQGQSFDSADLPEIYPTVESGEYGWGLALDGAVLAIGDRDGADDAAARKGHVIILRKVSGTWTVVQRIFPDVLAEFGTSVALDTANKRLIVGGHAEDFDVDSGPFRSGSVRIYTEPTFVAPGYATVARDGAFERQRFSIAMWIDHQSAGASPGLIIQKKRGTDLYSWRATISGSAPDQVAFNIRFTDATTISVIDPTSLSGPASFNHIGVSWDGTTLKLYRDGVLVDSDASGSGKTIDYNLTDPTYIGAGPDAAHQSCQCKIDDLAVYSEAQTAEWFRRMANNSDYTRPGLRCLLIPDREIGFGLDLKTMTCDASALEFKLKNIADPFTRADSPRTYLFAKKFSPGVTALATTQKTTTRRIDVDDTKIDAGATVIYVQDKTGFATSGEAHIGQETFSYTGVGTELQTNFPVGANQTIGKFTGVIKGIYPALRTANRGRTYPHPRTHDETAGDIGRRLVVSSEPYALIGREVGLYRTAWDPQNGKFFSEEGELVWAGQVTEDMTYDPVTDQWTLTCESILKMLERPIMNAAPRLNVEGINLNGALGRKWMVIEGRNAIGRFEVAAKYYESPMELAHACATEMADQTNWAVTAVAGAALGPHAVVAELDDSGKIQFRVSKGTGFDEFLWRLVPLDPSALGGPSSNPPCHALQALGFSTINDNQFELAVQGTGRAIGYFVADQMPYDHYQPADNRFNGSKLRGSWDGNDIPWDDQGDYGTALAWFAAEDQLIEGIGGAKGLYLEGVTSKAATSQASGRVAYEYTLGIPAQLAAINADGGRKSIKGFAGARKSALVLKQVYVPAYVPQTFGFRGPLAQKLFPLLSSGTTDYNDSTYDKMPYQLSVDFPVELVDVASVLLQDGLIIGEHTDLARRELYVIDESVSWLDIWKQEAMLFGVALCWDQQVGKLVCKSIISPDDHLATITIDESARVGRDEYPAVSINVSQVINQWRLIMRDRIGDSLAKLGLDTTFNDVESQQGLTQVKSVKIEHRGMRRTGVDNQVFLQGLIRLLLQDREHLFRYAHQIVSVALAGELSNQIAIGDVVIYGGAKHPDPFGSGAMTVSDLRGLLLDTSFPPYNGRGTATILVFSQQLAALKTPWANGALVDITATNGGWDDANDRLTLVALEYGQAGDPDDGSDWVATDEVLVIESAAEDPTSPQSWGPFVVASNYETDGAQILTLAGGTTMAGWDPDKEHRVVAADHDDINAAQRARGTHQASPTTHKLGTGLDAPSRWG